MGAFVFLAMRSKLDETLSPKNSPANPRELAANYGTLLGSPHFVGFTLIYGFMQGAFFSFLAVGAPFFQSQFGIGAATFGVVWGMLAVAYVAGAAVGGRMTPIVGSRTVMQWSVVLLLLAGILMLWVSRLDTLTPLIVLSPLGLMMMIAGSGTPGAMAGAVRYHPTMAGTASGLSSAIALVLGGSFTITSGLLYDSTLAPIAGLIFFACVAAAASWLLAGRQSAVTS